MNSQVTFEQFDALLEALGFQKEVIRGSHVNYSHASLDAPLMIRLHKPKDLVPSYVLLGTRVELDNFGILAAHEFDEKLTQVAA